MGSVTFLHDPGQVTQVFMQNDKLFLKISFSTLETGNSATWMDSLSDKDCFGEDCFGILKEGISKSLGFEF